MRRELRVLITVGAYALSAAAAPDAQAQNCTIQWAASPLPPATQGQPYTQSLYGGGGPTGIVTGAPRGLAVVGRTVQGTPEQAGTFDLLVVANLLPYGTCSNQADSAVLKLTVRDTEPPRIFSWSVLPDTVPSSGGDVRVTVKAADNVVVGKVVSSRTFPDGTGSSGILGFLGGMPYNGTWTMRWTLPANGSTAPVSYVIKVWVLDGANNQTRGTPDTVVVRARPTGLPVLRP